MENSEIIFKALRDNGALKSGEIAEKTGLLLQFSEGCKLSRVTAGREKKINVRGIATDGEFLSLLSDNAGGTSAYTTRIRTAAEKSISIGGRATTSNGSSPNNTPSRDKWYPHHQEAYMRYPL